MNTVLGPPVLATTNQADPPNSLTDRGKIVSSNFWWLAFVGVVSALLCSPFLRTIYAVSDEGVLLDGAERILRGDRIYVDFFSYLPPGGFVIVAAWFGIAGVSMMSARVLAALVIVGIACFTYLTCRLVSRSAPFSALLVLGWVVMSQGVGTQVSHHWVTTLFAMICAWASIRRITNPQRWLGWPLIAGAAAGAAGMVTSTRGALAMLAAMTGFLSGSRYKAQTGIFLIATAIVPTCLILYVIWLGALIARFDDVIVFDATRYSSVQPVPFGWDASQQDLPLLYLFPLTALLTLLTFVRDCRTALHDRIFRSCIAFGLAAVIGCYPRPDMFHIAIVVPLMCPLVACCLDRLIHRWLPIYRYVAVAVVIGACLPATRAFSWVFQKALHGEIVSTPRGNVTLAVNGAREMVARIASTPSRSGYFYYPTEDLLPFLTARPQAGGFDRLVPNYSTPAQYQDACFSMMRSAEWIVIARMDSTGWKAQYPAMANAEPKERMLFEHIMDGASEFVARDGWFELRRRVPGIDASACTGITN